MTTSVGSINGDLTLDISHWVRNVDEAKAKARELDAASPDIKVTADTATASTQLSAVKEKVDAVAAAEMRLKAAVSASDRATAQATIAQMRLTELRDKGKNKASTLAAAEEALRYAIERSETAATRASVAEDALSAARARSAAAAAEAAAAADAEAAAEDKETAATERSSVAHKESAKQINAIAAAVALLGPQLIPATAAAVGLAGGFTLMGAAGVLAVLGIKNEMASGTAEGKTYQGIIQTLKGDLADLEHTAATAAMPGVTKSVALLQAAMPELNRETSTFTGLLGQATPAGLDAILTMLTRAEPLFDHGGEALVRMADGVDRFAHSQQFGQFLSYADANLPKFLGLLQDAVKLAGDFLTDMAPYAGTMLAVTDGVLKVADALTPIAPLIWGVWTAFTVWRGVGPLLDTVVTKLRAVGTEATITGEKVAASGAGGGAGGGLAGLKGVGAVAGAVGVLGAYQAADSSTATKTRLTNEIPEANRVKALSSSFNSNIIGAGGSGFAFGTTFADQDKQLAQLVQSGNAQKAAQMWAAMGKEAATDGISISQLTAAYPKYSSAVATSQGKAKSATDASARSVNTLIDAWVKANAAQSAASTSAQSLESTQDQAKDAISGLTAAVKANGTSLSQSTDKGRANREQVLQAVQAAQAYGTEVSKVTGSTAAGRVATDKMAISLENTMTKLGMSKSAAQQYVDKLLGIPAGRSTRLDLQQAEAAAKLEAFKIQWDAVQSKTVTLFARTNTINDSGIAGSTRGNGTGYGVMATGGTAGRDGFHRAATGSTVRGPGTSTSDSVPYLLSVGEEITRADQASRFRPVLKAINAGDAAGAAAALGSQTPEVHVHVAPKIPGMSVDELVDVKITNALKRHDAAAARGLKAGYMARGLLAGPGS